MYKRELINRISNNLRENDIRKNIRFPQHVLHISDDEGNKKDFVIKKVDKGAIYTEKDIESILDACIAVIEDALKKGEEVSINGFGTLKLNYRPARWTIHPKTGENVDVRARYTPKFTFGKDLKMCAKIYELSLGDKIWDPNIQEYDEEGDD